MIRRSHILETIRRRRARLGGFVLAFFAVASVAAGAAPCFSMGAAANAASPAHHASHSDSMPAGHAMPASDHDHSHAAAHDASTPTDGSPDSPSSPGDCPHCPLAASMPGHAAATTHSVCAAADDTSDFAQPGASSLLPKYAAPALMYELPPLRPDRPPGSRTSRVLVPSSSSVPLNLRHCVFLI
jgi:hypothetical protein